MGHNVAQGQAYACANARAGRGRCRPKVGADETYACGLRGRSVCLGIVTDAQTGETLGVDLLVDQGAAGFLRWLPAYVAPLGVQVLVTDDLSTFKPVLERLAVAHELCIAHVRKNVTKRLHTLPGQEAVKEAVRELVRDFPPWGARALRDLTKTLRRHVASQRRANCIGWKFGENPVVPYSLAMRCQYCLSGFRT